MTCLKTLPDDWINININIDSDIDVLIEFGHLNFCSVTTDYYCKDRIMEKITNNNVVKSRWIGNEYLFEKWLYLKEIPSYKNYNNILLN